MAVSLRAAACRRAGCGAWLLGMAAARAAALQPKPGDPVLVSAMLRACIYAHTQHGYCAAEPGVKRRRAAGKGPVDLKLSEKRGLPDICYRYSLP